MFKKILSIFAIIAFLLVGSPVLADGSGTMQVIGDSVQLTPNSSGQTLFSITGATSSNAVIGIKQCSNPINTSNCVPVNSTQYGQSQSTSAIIADGNYYLSGSGNFYYLLSLVSVTGNSPNIVVSTITTTPPAVSSGGSGGSGSGSSAIVKVPFTVLVEGGANFSFSSQNYAVSSPEGYVINTDSSLNGNSIKYLYISCLAYNAYQASYQAVYQPEDNGLNGGTVTYEELDANGTNTTLGTVTLPSAPHGGPYINSASTTLSTPVTPQAGSTITAYVSTFGSGSDQSWMACEPSIGQ